MGVVLYEKLLTGKQKPSGFQSGWLFIVQTLERKFRAIGQYDLYLGNGSVAHQANSHQVAYLLCFQSLIQAVDACDGLAVQLD